MNEVPHRTLYALTRRLCLLGLVLDWLLFVAAAALLVLRAVSGPTLLPLLLIPPGLLAAILVHAVLVNALAVTRLGDAPSPARPEAVAKGDRLRSG
jgi:hypothetical protein